MKPLDVVKSSRATMNQAIQINLIVPRRLKINQPVTSIETNLLKIIVTIKASIIIITIRIIVIKIDPITKVQFQIVVTIRRINKTPIKKLIPIIIISKGEKAVRHSHPFRSIPIHSDKFSVCLFPGQGLKI